VTDRYSLPYLTGLLRTGCLPGVDFRPTVIGTSCERLDENVATNLSSSRLGSFFARLYMRRNCGRPPAVTKSSAEFGYAPWARTPRGLVLIAGP
jgi:hypothetical protein